MSPRRRVRGLSRDEVATLVGIGSSYYAWIEQGRPLNISEEVQRRMRQVLRLSRAQSRYLQALCNPKLEEEPLAQAVSEPTQRLLDRLYDVPAFALNARWDVLATNETARRVFGWSPVLRSSEEHNLLRWFFTQTSDRIANDRDTFSRRLVGAFRLRFALNLGQRGGARRMASCGACRPTTSCTAS
jgi:transcriptional regulator with XRE-family HTH domain